MGINHFQGKLSDYLGGEGVNSLRRIYRKKSKMLFITYCSVKTAKGSKVSVGAATPAILMAIFLFILPQVLIRLFIYLFILSFNSFTGSHSFISFHSSTGSYSFISFHSSTGSHLFIHVILPQVVIHSFHFILPQVVIHFISFFHR